MSEYIEKLKDPRWQRVRLKVFEREDFSCQCCGSTEETLHVHHLIYSKGEPWDAPMETLECLCKSCHELREMFNEIIDRTTVPTFFFNCFTRFFAVAVSKGNIPEDQLGDKFALWYRCMLKESRKENKCKIVLDK